MTRTQKMNDFIKRYVDLEAEVKAKQEEMKKLIALMEKDARKYGITIYEESPLATFSLIPERTDITVDSAKVKKIENWEELFGKERHTKEYGKISRKTKGTERQARANG